jgi:hypothetical protein
MRLFVLIGLAETCIDLEDVNPVDPTIQRSRHKGQLYVKLNHATNLRDKDWFTKSDPYVEMWLEKAYKRRSKDVAKNLNPIYNETFCFYVRPGQDKLHVRVIDKDTISDDKIGDTSISLDNVFKTGREEPQDYELPKWFGLWGNGYALHKGRKAPPKRFKATFASPSPISFLHPPLALFPYPLGNSLIKILSMLLSDYSLVSPNGTNVSSCGYCKSLSGSRTYGMIANLMTCKVESQHQVRSENSGLISKAACLGAC